MDLTEKLNELDKLSPECRDWIVKRERHLKARDAFWKEGGHIMLKSSVYDPEELPEPIRSEALGYFNKVRSG